MILLLARITELSVQRDGGIWSFLKWTRSRLSLHWHPETSLKVVEVETLLILQENPFDFLHELGGPVSKWMFSGLDLLQWILFVHLRLKKMNFPFLEKYHLFRIESFWVDFRCVHRFQLLKVCDQYVTLPNSTRVQSVSEEQSRKNFPSKLMDAWQILHSYGVILNQWTKWNNRSLKWLPKTSLVGRLPIR